MTENIEPNDCTASSPSVDDLPLDQLAALLEEASHAVVRRLSAPDALRELSPMSIPDTGTSGSQDWGAMLCATEEIPGLDSGPVSPQDSTVPADSKPADGEVADVDTAPTSGNSDEGGPEQVTATGHHHASSENFAPPTADFTLPALHQTLETASRAMAAAQMSLTGHTVETFENPMERQRLLGLPEGKTAFRDAADYLKLVLRIDGTEARRRTRWAVTLRPVRTLSGELLPPVLPRLSEVVHEGLLDRSAVDFISTAIDNAKQMAHRVEADPEAVSVLLDQGEDALVEQAQSVDPGSLRKVCTHWLKWFEAAVDPDGSEPNDAELPQLQGMIRKGKRNGLHQWLLAVNDEQNEYLLTVANAAANPRAKYRGPNGDCDDAGAGWDESVDELLTAEVLSEDDGSSTAVPALDPRSTNQKQLDGLIACLAGGLAMIESNKLPTTGGTRPQVTVTIDFHTLLGDLVKAGAATAEDLRLFESSATFTGSIHPNNIRTMACDADIIPVVLGSDGEVLDVGRTKRLFPSHLRQAIAARDGGCAAPGCWVPAPWCDIHHVEHWAHGGPTSTDNGVLLCNHHHHAVHADAWKINMRSGRPWFIPAPYLDPRQQPQRNRYWRR